MGVILSTINGVAPCPTGLRWKVLSEPEGPGNMNGNAANGNSHSTTEQHSGWGV